MSITFSFRGSAHDLNVSSRNGCVILRNLLGLERPEEWGEMDAGEVLRQLSTARLNLSGLTIPVSETRGERVILSPDGVDVRPGCLVIDSGLSASQLARYINVLTLIARRAEAAGEPITWG